MNTLFSCATSSRTVSHDESEKRLPRSCLVALCKFEPVLRWTRECDNLLYQTLVEILIPDVLRPIPSYMRYFPFTLFQVVCIGAFSQTLRRYTSLNHLAQAARAVLQNSAQINQMLSDLNRVDFTNVQVTVYKLMICFFPSSMVIRDLTLRSAASFGSFHLIRLLYDEYMYYLIEHRVAKAKGETPIACLPPHCRIFLSEEEEDDDEEDSDEESGEIMLQSSSLKVDEEKSVMEPPAKQPRTSLNLHTLAEVHGTPP
ncbi:hypothetical protein XENOCAPTIV_024565 [Xenoophorus captivus]|uniref:RFX1-4/6/8-like BCD domain-containing protein n=1 Tax=Xenoophorus captivus TaxID=1517983 RepID=A0ABV0SCD0_9TELE